MKQRWDFQKKLMQEDMRKKLEAGKNKQVYMFFLKCKLVMTLATGSTNKMATVIEIVLI